MIGSDVTPRRVQLTIDVDVDPARYGFGLSTSDAEAIVVAAINARAGLEVAEEPVTVGVAR